MFKDALPEKIKTVLTKIAPEEEPDPNMMPGHPFSWEEVKAFFTDHIREFETCFME